MAKRALKISFHLFTKRIFQSLHSAGLLLCIGAAAALSLSLLRETTPSDELMTNKNPEW